MGGAKCTARTARPRTPLPYTTLAVKNWIACMEYLQPTCNWQADNMGQLPTPFIQKIQIQLLNCLELFIFRIFYTCIFRLVD
jgi:hypothetical protein